MSTIPQGYKDSKVGIIPEDWEIITIGDLFTFKNGLNKGKEFFGKGTPIVNYVDVYKKQFLTQDNFDGLVSVTDAELKNYQVKKGDVFFTRTSETIEEIGYSTVVLEDIEDTVFSGFVLRGRPKNKLLDDNYKKYCFSTFEARKEIIRKSSMTTRALTNGTLLSGVLLAKPPKEEQAKIAEILTTWDNAIEKQESLIQEKEQLKKGLMQKLLSGEKRFDGFDDEWEEVELKTFMVERNIKSPKSKEYPLMAFIAYKGVADKGDRYNREFLVSDESNKKYKQTEYGDFIYSSNNLETGSIGMNKFGSATISPVYSIFQISESCDAKFMSYFLVTKSFISKMVRYRQGVMYGQWRIHESDFLRIRVKIPCLEEQNKIAEVLSYADNEIELLKQELDELKLQKKGLMQNLLTGKVRVKV